MSTRTSSLESHSARRVARVELGPPPEARARTETAAELAAKAALATGFSDLGSWTWQPHEDRMYATEGSSRVLGVAHGTPVTLERALAAMPADDAVAVRERFQSLVDGGSDATSVSYRLRGADGNVRWMEGYCVAVRDENGVVEKVMGLSRDVTERVEAADASIRIQRELESARDYLRAVTDTMDESMFTLDPAGRVVYINPAAERLLGWSYAELLGNVMHDIAHRERPDGSPYPVEECPIMTARAEGRVIEVAEDSFVRKDGTHLPVSYTALPFTAGAGIEGCVVIFEDITEKQAEERRVACDREKLAWATRIRDALTHDRFELYGQPIVDCRSGQVVQRELLLRLHDPRGWLVSPAAFLPVAEELGLIREIDRWVIGRAAELAREHGALEVNLSARSIEDPHLIDHIAAAIAHAGVDPSLLGFEITETALIGDAGAAGSFLDRLRRLGCKIALDDFGTGYGGFSYLKQLPVDTLKIDAEFVCDLRDDPRNRNVVQAVVGLARGFGLTTVAEGVEDQETFEQLVALGVDHAQGYHLGRPQPLGERRADRASAGPGRAASAGSTS